MEEVKSPRNKLDIEVNVDTDEVEVKLERLKKATEGCTKAFEELGDAIANLGVLFNNNQAECAPFDIDLALSEKKQLKEWLNGKG
ncbi:hypothetical protein [Bacillus toyonensis]|uniref:hypothetical protein n=1 Tax=Bacillus toyonensis TaxID=155322 RepID=UPI000BFD26A7|nr:hypothetical protein [Bacillus toyonensis]PHD38278.1 hypothetical protein COF48_00525 [Bacillus toyonensis]